MKDSKSVLNNSMISDYIKKERKKRGLRGEDFKKPLGKGAAYISQIESGKIKFIKLDTLERILEIIHEDDSEQTNIQKTIDYLTQFESTPQYTEKLSFEEMSLPLLNVFREIYDNGDDNTKSDITEVFRAIETNITQSKENELGLLRIVFPNSSLFDNQVIKDVDKELCDLIEEFNDRINTLWDRAEICNCHKVYDRIYSKIKKSIEEISGVADANLKTFEICMDLNELLITIKQFFFASIRQEENNFEVCKKYLNNMIPLQKQITNILRLNLPIPKPVVNLSEIELSNKIKEIQRTNLDLLNKHNRSSW